VAPPRKQADNREDKLRPKSRETPVYSKRKSEKRKHLYNYRGHREKMNAIKLFLSLCSLCPLW